MLRGQSPKKGRKTGRTGREFTGNRQGWPATTFYWQGRYNQECHFFAYIMEGSGFPWCHCRTIGQAESCEDVARLSRKMTRDDARAQPFGDVADAGASGWSPAVGAMSTQE